MFLLELHAMSKVGRGFDSFSDVLSCLRSMYREAEDLRTLVVDLKTELAFAV